jgi:rod shape-determining protein MreC
MFLLNKLSEIIKFTKKFLLVILLLLSLFVAYKTKENVMIFNNAFGVVGEKVSEFSSYITNFFSLVANLSSVYANIEILKKNNYELIQEIRGLQYIKSENNALRKMLNFHAYEQYSFITARMVGILGDPYSHYATIIISNKDKIKKNQLVVNEKGLIGKIQDIKDNHAKVMLVTDNNFRISVITEGKRYNAILSGNGSDYLELKYLPDNIKLEEGELVYTSGDGEIFPSAIVIGKIVKYKDKYYVTPLIDKNYIEYVKVLFF